MNIETISSREVTEARDAMFRAFYFRPSFLLKQIFHFMAHPGQILQASRFLGWMRAKR